MYKTITPPLTTNRGQSRTIERLRLSIMTTNPSDPQASAKVADVSARTQPATAPFVGGVTAGVLTSAAGQFLSDRDTEVNLSDVECHLLTFLEGKGLPTLCWDDPAFVARCLTPEGGQTLAELAQEKRDFLSARRELVNRLRTFCDAVEADDAKREETLVMLEIYRELDTVGRRFIRELIAELTAANAAGVKFDHEEYRANFEARYRALHKEMTGKADSTD